MDVDEEMEVSEEIGSYQGQCDISNNEVPRVCLSCYGDFHETCAICLDRRTVGSYETSVGASGEGRGVSLWDKRSTRPRIDEIFYLGPVVCEKINVRRFCRCCDDNWRYLVKFRPGTGILTLLCFRSKVGVVETQYVAGVAVF